MNNQMGHFFVYMVEVIRNGFASHVISESILENGTFPAVYLEKVSYA